MPSPNTLTISADAPCLTLINVYDVEPENQRPLVELLSDVTEGVILRQPGCVSVCIHSSLDGTRVVNYAQWASREAFDGFMRQPETPAQLARFAALARSVSPSLMQVDAVHRPARET